MRIRRNIGLAMAIPFLAMGVAQAASDQGLDTDVTTFSDNPLLALRSELRTPTPHSTVAGQRDEIRLLRRRLKRLSEEYAALQASICSCTKQSLKIHAAFKKPEPVVNNNSQSVSSFSADADLLLPMMGFDKPNTKQMGANSHRTAASSSSTSKSDTHKQIDMLVLARLRKVIWREKMVYCLLLGIATFYITSLILVFIKTTADAKFRRGEQRSTKNAALHYWTARHRHEREMKAMKEEKYQLKIRREFQELKKQKTADAKAKKEGRDADAGNQQNADADKHEKNAENAV